MFLFLFIANGSVSPELLTDPASTSPGVVSDLRTAARNCVGVLGRKAGKGRGGGVGLQQGLCQGGWPDTGWGGVTVPFVSSAL